MQLREWNARLHGLVVFRALLGDPVVAKLAALTDRLEAADDTIAPLCDAVAAFEAALFAHTTNLGDYLSNAVLETETVCVRQAAAGQLSPVMEAALNSELNFLQKLCGLKKPPVFTPIVDDYYKGMATTIQLHNRYLRGQPTAREICHILAAYYAGQPLVSVRWGGDAPTLPANALAGTDRLELVVCGHEEQTIVTALFDNLGKGASGAAVQNMNLMLGFEMTAGLALETPPAGSPASARSERT